MRGNELLDMMEFVDPVFIEAADTRPNFPKRNWIKWSSLAACFAIILYIGTKTFSPEPTEIISELQTLTISEDTSNSMGFEGYKAYNISEVINSNPWSEEIELSTLPVYKNQEFSDEDHTVSNEDIIKMKEFSSEVAERFGLNTSVLDINYDPTYLTAETTTDTMTIQVDQSMTAAISFEPAISLPEEYNFTANASYEETFEAAQYLKNTYPDIIGIVDPEINIQGGNYNIYLQQNYNIEFFDANGNNIEKIVNYNFNRVAFYGDDDGKLFLVRIFQPNLSQKLGDYPIITTAEATELLLNAHYITTVPYEMAGENYIAKVELIYRTSTYEQYYMPYYRFYVEIPELEEDGLKTYGAYYVPAIESQYITNMPLWDSSFN